MSVIVQGKKDSAHVPESIFPRAKGGDPLVPSIIQLIIRRDEENEWKIEDIRIIK